MAPLLLTACGVDRTITLGGLGFQAAVLAASTAGLLWLARFRERLAPRVAAMALGVLIFELFTAPMWHNAHLGAWA